MAAVLLLLLWGVGGAFAQVSVSNLATDYATKKISFTVSWTATPHNNQIWVITDYIKIEGATTAGSWSRALVPSVSASGNGSAATVTGNLGFWLNTSGSSGSANVTATLSGVPVQFNWCAYALNYPPKAVINPAGGYELQGTPPFTVNGMPLGDNVTTFGAGTCITSLSDATNNPTSDLPDPPAINLTSANSSQTVTAGSAITQIKYNTSNATGANISGTPTGVTGSWSSNVYTISGTPTSSGTYNYTVTTTNSNGCANATASGTITVQPAVDSYGCYPSTLTLTGVGFANSNTYTRNGITISAPVTVTTCQKTTYSGGSSGSYNADCRTNPSYDGDLFSWCMVVQHAVQLCPSTWRVPTRNDYCKYAGFADVCTMPTSDLKSGMEGWLLGGYCNPTGLLYGQGAIGYYLCSSEYSSDCGDGVFVDDSVCGPYYDTDGKCYGFALRCVR
jgi:hypothetical protein